jgi:Zn-dependent M28 family amino/carboxypeptidase
MMMPQEQLQLLKWQNISVPLNNKQKYSFVFFCWEEKILVGSKHLPKKLKAQILNCMPSSILKMIGVQ